MMISARSRQLFGAVVVSLVHFLAGSSVTLSSIIIPSLQMSTEEISWFASILFLGVLIGSVSGCLYCDLIGWRSSLILDSLGFSIGFLLIGFGEQSIYFLCLGRFLNGFFTGTTKCSMMVYICEFSQPDLRGLLGAVNLMIFMDRPFNMQFLSCEA